ncbi:MAG: phosphocholine cytidylyltransferase family protein [Candidatus Marinimicrobia bacterium]|nr:phosphocholine cytidylyltransferase family protein [Candidatus Neomarinimicrobiota bacterium]
MQAIIVAAGTGRRLRPLTDDRPKALLELQGRSLIRRSVEQLLGVGVQAIAVVVGYLKEQMVEHLEGLPVTYFENPDYEHTNNMASLWHASSFVRETCLYLHSDLIFDDRLLRQLAESSLPDALLVEEKVCDAEDMKVAVRNGRLVAASKELPAAETFGEWTGMAKFSRPYWDALMAQIETLLAQGQRQAYDTLAFTELARQGRAVGIESFTGWPWAEIDTPADLEAARRLFPAAPDAGG